MNSYRTVEPMLLALSSEGLNAKVWLESYEPGEESGNRHLVSLIRTTYGINLTLFPHVDIGHISLDIVGD
jgi:hypothetical protein